MKATIRHITSVPGLSIQSVITREGSGGLPPQEKTLPPGIAGTLANRVDDDAADIKLAAGHNLSFGDKVDIYWGAGKGGGLRRYVNIAAVKGNLITVEDHGPGKSAGDRLPDQGKAVAVSKRTVLGAPFDGNKLSLLVATASRRANLEFRDAADALLDQAELAAGEPYQFVSAAGMINRLAGNPVATVHVSGGEPKNPARFKMGGVYQSDSGGETTDA